MITRRLKLQAGQKTLGLKATTPWDIGDTEACKAEAKALYAQILGDGVDARDVAFTPSTSYAMSLAALNLAPRIVGEKREVVVLEDQMHSNVLPWQKACEERGGRMRIVARPADGDWTAAALRAISRATAIVALPPCHWACGGTLDLIRIGEVCRTVGAALAIDGTQYIGAVPLAVGAIQPDFVAASVHKWLLSPYGASVVYVAPQHHAVWQPLEQHDRNRQGADDVDTLPMDQALEVGYPTAFYGGARRFDSGGRPHYCLMPMIRRAFELVLELGVARVAKRLEGITDRIADGAEALGFVVPPKQHRAPHIVGLQPRPGMPSTGRS